MVVAVIAVGVGDSGPGRASTSPSARRSAARPAADRPAARRRRRACRRGTRRPPPASAAGRSGRTTAGGSASSGRPPATGSAPAAASRRRMNRSIGLSSGPEPLETSGTSGRLGGRYAQCPFHSAPCSIQARIRSTCSASTACARPSAGGIRISSSSEAIRSKSSLSSGLPGHEDRRVLGLPEQPLARVEPQVGLPLVRVRPVALVAVLREDRADVAVEVDRLGRVGMPVSEADRNRSRSSVPAVPGLPSRFSSAPAPCGWIVSRCRLQGFRSLDLWKSWPRSRS